MKNKVLCFLLIVYVANCFAGAGTFLDNMEAANDIHERIQKESGDIQEPTKKSDKFNFFSDICWWCGLPIHIGGFKLSNQEDLVEYRHKEPEDAGIGKGGNCGEVFQWIKSAIHFIKEVGCLCDPITIGGLTVWAKVAGFKVAFWEPQSIIEVTRVPYKSILFGFKIGNARGYEKYGSTANADSGRTSFYNVHHIAMPLFRIMAIFPGFTCLRKVDIGLPIFMSEWDPAWNDMTSKLHWVMDPERFLYASPEMQAVCKIDCLASESRKPTDKYHWCAGCLGSTYPYTGHVGYHIGGIQASSLLLTRWLSLIHSVGKWFPKKWNVFGLGMGFEPDNFCEKSQFPRLKKTIYKTQLIYPVPESKGERKKDGKTVYCHPLGESDRFWGAGRTYPDGGEDFAYLVWTKMQCCFDLTDVVFKFFKKKDGDGIIDNIEEVEEIYEIIKKLDAESLIDPSSVNEANDLFRKIKEKHENEKK